MSRIRWIAACFGCAAVVGSAHASPSLNLAQATADTKAKLDAGGQANIILMGDSLTFDDAFSYRPYFTQHMQAHYGNAGPGYLGAAMSMTDYGPEWRTGVVGPADPAPHSALDGLWVTAPASSTRLSVGTFFTEGDHVDLQYLAQPGGGKFDLILPHTGTFVTRLDTSAAAPEVRTFRYQFAPGVQQAVCIAPDGSGPVTILGQTPVTDAAGVRVHRVANGGWGVDQFLQRDTSFDQQLSLLKTDMVMVAVGVNDAGKPRDEFVQKLNLLIDRIQADAPTSEIVMVAPYDFGTPQAPVVAGAIEQVAADRNLGLINLYETAGSHDFFVSHNYLSDGLHFNPAGGEYVGNLLYEAFLTNGASLGTVPEPTSLLGAAAAGFLLLRRRR